MLNHTSLKLSPGMTGSWLKRAGFLYRFLTLMLLFAVGSPLLLQAQEFRASGDEAMALFSSGRYNEAINHFEILAVQFPDDPLYKYYYGRTLLELERDHDKAASLLEAAVKGSTGLRSVPSDARFWLARAFHLAGMFDRAIDNYDLFSAGARRKEVRGLKVEEYSEQASRGLGAAMEVSSEAKKEALSRDAEKAVEGSAEGGEIRHDTVGAKRKEERGGVDRIPVDGNYDIMAKEALAFQFRADSVNRLADRYRERLGSLAGVERASAEQKILSLERMGFRYQGRADTLFNLLTSRVDASVVTPDKERPVAAVDKFEVAEVDSTADAAAGRVAAVNNVAVAASGNVAVAAADTLLPGEKRKVSISASDQVVLMLFRTNQDDAGEILINPEMPEGLVYRVQIAAFRNPIAASYFKNFSPVYGIRAEDSDITFYYIGMFRKKSDADRAVAQIRSTGFSDAFVVPVNNGTKVSLERAAEMEKEWGNKSLLKGVDVFTEPSTLVYRVEAARVTRELKGDDAEAIRRVAGNRGLDKITASDGTIVYLIGKFLTFESASGYADLIFRNGIGGAKVVAYLGDREIPIEKARELFELYDK